MHAKVKLGVESGGALGGSLTKKRKIEKVAAYSARKLVANKNWGVFGMR